MDCYPFDLREAVDYLKAMIAIPSVTGNEGKVGEYIESRLRDFGVDELSRQQVSDTSFNVVASIKGAKPGHSVLLTGHMDTVGVSDGWDSDPFVPREENGRIFGRGSNDMKSGIAVILTVAHVLCRHKDRLCGTVQIAFVVDEERFSTGAATLLKNGLTADFALSAEPAFDTIIIGAVGKVLISAEVTGKTAHGSEPENGINAIIDAARLTAALDTLELMSSASMKAQPYVPLRIVGGKAEYSIDIPDKCTLLINKQMVPGETAQSVVAALQQLVSQLNLRSEFTFHLEPPHYPPYAVDTQLPYLQKLVDCYSAVIGQKPQIGYDDGVSDNNYYAADANIPTVCLGPTGEGMHGANEWVSVSQMEAVGKIYLQFLLG